MEAPNVLAVNAGSSSIRLALLGAGGGERAEVRGGRLDPGERQSFLDRFLAGRAPPAATAHRIVHGGSEFSGPVRVDPEIRRRLEALSPLAPLHQPENLAWLDLAMAALPDAVHVAAFDTAFHAGMPPAARAYAIDPELAARHGYYRYGFHGLAYQSLHRQLAERDPAAAAGRVVAFQLGAGCSACAIRGGRSVETTMGYSPLEGLAMATRCGDVDASVVLDLLRTECAGPDDAEEILTRRSGLFGLAGEKEMEKLLARDDYAARHAIDVFVHRARKAFGALTAVLGGVDAVVFGGGIGENAPEIRARILADQSFIGIELDPAANAAASGTAAQLSPFEARTSAWTFPVDEARELALATSTFLPKPR